MRPIDADNLTALIQDATILTDGFKQAFCALVNGEPTLDVEDAVWGTWKKKDYGWVCSKCGCRVVRRDPFRGNVWSYNYCPNCGARMTE